MKIVAIKDMSRGNEHVGEMWQETLICDPSTPVEEIIRWAVGSGCLLESLRKRITITVASEVLTEEDLNDAKG